MDQVNFLKHLSRPYHFKFFKGYLPQNSLGLFLNTLSQMRLRLSQKFLKNCLLDNQFWISYISNFYIFNTRFFFQSPQKQSMRFRHRCFPVNFAKFYEIKHQFTLMPAMASGQHHRLAASGLHQSCRVKHTMC